MFYLSLWGILIDKYELYYHKLSIKWTVIVSFCEQMSKLITKIDLKMIVLKNKQELFKMGLFKNRIIRLHRHAWRIDSIGWNISSGLNCEVCYHFSSDSTSPCLFNLVEPQIRLHICLYFGIFVRNLQKALYLVLPNLFSILGAQHFGSFRQF